LRWYYFPIAKVVYHRRYLEELKMYVSHHRQLDTKIARIAASDNDVHLLMTILGINCSSYKIKDR